MIKQNSFRKKKEEKGEDSFGIGEMTGSLDRAQSERVFQMSRNRSRANRWESNKL